MIENPLGKPAPVLRDDIVTELVRYGYVPGYYSGKCKSCNERMIADKKAWHCAECAIATALAEAKKLDPIHAIKTLFEASTDGPWVYTTDPAHWDSPAVEMARYGPAASYFRTDADAKFVAAMREAVAEILKP